MPAPGTILAPLAHVGRPRPRRAQRVGGVLPRIVAATLLSLAFPALALADNGGDHADGWGDVAAAAAAAAGAGAMAAAGGAAGGRRPPTGPPRLELTMGEPEIDPGDKFVMGEPEIDPGDRFVMGPPEIRSGPGGPPDGPN